MSQYPARRRCRREEKRRQTTMLTRFLMGAFLLLSTCLLSFWAPVVERNIDVYQGVVEKGLGQKSSEDVAILRSILASERLLLANLPDSMEKAVALTHNTQARADIDSYQSDKAEGRWGTLQELRFFSGFSKSLLLLGVAFAAAGLAGCQRLWICALSGLFSVSGLAVQIVLYGFVAALIATGT
ncbi:hypothetical protein [uncultured Mitsuokella sp.]|uniref:hypothetical protein n=1 Tax=uncultured Mitsuokella sp. TaxID=453120 RepID=UPI0026062F75|nr:hypothetical protein [uncultured Mitsuokella sp.]